MGELLPGITELRLDQIEVGTGRLREVDPAGVAALVTVIREIGFTTPVIVRRVKARFELIDGAHRCAAMRELGQETVPVRAYSCNAREARQMESSANLAGAGLTPLDDAVFLAAWKKSYEEAHPETRQGVAGGLARHGLAAELNSVADVIAAKRSITPRQVRRIIQVGEALSRDEVRWLRSAPRKVRLVDLMQIAKIGEDAERAKVCIALANGEAKSAAEARAKYRAERGEGPAPKDPFETALNALQSAWDRAPKAAKRQFVEMNLDALLPIVRDADLGAFKDLAGELTEMVVRIPGAPEE